MGKPQQTEITRIADPQKRRVALAKRYPTLFKKARELSIFTDSDLFLGVRSSTGRTFFCNYQRGKPIASNIDPGTGKVNSSMGPKESLIATYKASLAFALEVLGNLENDPPVKAGDSVVKVDRGTYEVIGSILKSFGLDGEFSMDKLFELAESGVRNDDRPESSTVGGGFHHLDDFPELDDLDVDLDLHGF